MNRGIVGVLAVLVFLVVELPVRATAAVLTTRTQAFIGEAGAVTFPGDVPQCDAPTKAVDTLILPGSTLAPTSAATQLSWTPAGSQSSGYRISLINPTGSIAFTWTIGANSTAQVTYFAAGAPGGPWAFHEEGLRSSFCSEGSLMGSPGTATGTAAWYQP